MLVDPQLLERFFLRERAFYGGGRVRYKDEEWGSKVRGFYARLFNPRYMQGYITTLYPDTFFPSALYVQKNVYRATKIEFHENVHKWDRNHEGFKFTIKYAFPQLFAVPFIIAAVALAGIWGLAGFATLLVLLHVGLGVLAASAGKADDGVPSKGIQALAWILTSLGGLAAVAGTVLGGGWFSLLWAPAALFLSPWPLKARWRRDYELRGYTMSLYSEWLRYGNVRPQIVTHYVEQFTGPAYFYMETDEDYVRKELHWQLSRFQLDEESFLRTWAWLDKDKGADGGMAEPYRMAKSFMVKEKLCAEK